jgi:hypothetical protein
MQKRLKDAHEWQEDARSWDVPSVTDLARIFSDADVSTLVLNDLGLPLSTFDQSSCWIT